MLSKYNPGTLGNIRRSRGFKFICLVLLHCFTFNVLVSDLAQASQLMLTSPGTLITSSAAVQYPVLRAIRVYPQNPFEIDFMIDSGDQETISRQDADTLIKYFLTTLTVPVDELWVNLSPYEPSRIIPDQLVKTELGRELLLQDYLLKQLSASMTYPETKLGQEFWSRVYKQIEDRYGLTDIPIHNFNKIWIVPERAVVYEKDNMAFVSETSLDVMLEEDYLAQSRYNEHRQEFRTGLSPDVPADDAEHQDKSNQIAAQIIKEIILPELKKEVNEGEHFASLRQVYYSLILALWYKSHLKRNIITELYGDQNKIKGIDSGRVEIKEEVYEQYIQALKMGVYNYVKEDLDENQSVIPRKYFSGGFSFKNPSQWLSFRSVSQYGGSVINLLDKLKKKLTLTKIQLKPIGVSASELIRSYQSKENSEPGTSSDYQFPWRFKLFSGLPAHFKKPIALTGMLVFLTLSNLALLSQASAATYTNDQQGNLVIQVEQGDTMGEILQDIRRSYRKHDRANFRQSEFSKPFWVEGGAVDYLTNTIVPNPDNPDLILTNQTFKMARGILPELVQQRLTGQPLPLLQALPDLSGGASPERAEGERQMQPLPRTDIPPIIPEHDLSVEPEVQERTSPIMDEREPVTDRTPETPKQGFFQRFFEIVFSVLAMVSFLFVFFQNRKGKERSETSKESFLRTFSDYLKGGQKNHFTLFLKEALMSKRTAFEQISAELKGEEVIVTLRAKNALNGRKHSKQETADAVASAFKSKDIRILANRGKPTELKLSNVEVKTTSIKLHLVLSRKDWKKGVRFKSGDPLSVSFRIRGEKFDAFEIPLVEERLQEFLDQFRATLAADKLYEHQQELELDRSKARQQKDLTKKRLHELKKERKSLLDQEKRESLKVSMLEGELRRAQRAHELAKDQSKRLKEIMSLEEWVLKMRRFREENPVVFKDVRGKSVETNFYLQELSIGMLERMKKENNVSEIFKQYFRETALQYTVIARLKGHNATLDTNQSLFLPTRDDLSFRLFHYPLDKWSRMISLSELAFGRAKRKALTAITDYYNSRRSLDRLEEEILGEENYVAGKSYSLENLQREFYTFTDGLEKPFPDSITGHDIWRRRAYVVSVLLVLWNLGFLINLFIPFLLAVGSFGLTRLIVPNSFIFATEREYQKKLNKLKSMDPRADINGIKAESSKISVKGEFLNYFSRHFMPKSKGWTPLFRLKSSRFYDVKTVRVNGHVELRIFAESFFRNKRSMLQNIQTAFVNNSQGTAAGGDDPRLKLYLIEEGRRVEVEPDRVSVDHHPTGIRINVQDVPAGVEALGIGFQPQGQDQKTVEIAVSKDGFIDLMNEWDQFKENPERLDLEPLNRLVTRIQQFMDSSDLKIGDFKKNAGYYNEIREYALDSYMVLTRANSPDLLKYQEYFLTLAQYANQVRLLMASFTGLYVLKSQFQEAKSRFLWKPFGITLAAKLRDFFGVTSLYEWSSNDVLVTIDEMSDTLKDLEIAQAKIISSSQPPIFRAALYERKLKNLRDEHDSIDSSYQYLPQHSLATGSDLHQRNFSMAMKFIYTVLFFISSVFVIVPTLDLVLEKLGLPSFPDITITEVFTTPEVFGLSLASLSIVYFIVISRILPYLAYMEPDEEFSFFENIIERFRNDKNISEEERNKLDEKMKNYLTKNRKMFSIPILLSGLLFPATIPVIFLSLEVKFALRKIRRERMTKAMEDETLKKTQFHDKVSVKSNRLINPLSQTIYTGPHVTISYEGQRQFYSESNKKPSVTYMKVYDAQLSPEGEDIFREAASGSDGKFILATDEEILNGRFETTIGGEPVEAVITRNVPPVLKQFDQLGMAERYRLFSAVPHKTVYDDRGDALERFGEVRVTVKSRVRFMVDGKLLLMRHGPVKTGKPVQYNTIGGGLELNEGDRKRLEQLGAHDFEVDQHNDSILDWRFIIPVKNLGALEKLIDEQQPHLAHFGKELIEELTMETDLLTQEKFGYVFGDMAVLANTNSDGVLRYSDFEKETAEDLQQSSAKKGGIDLRNTESKVMTIQSNTIDTSPLTVPAVPLINFQGMEFNIIQFTPMINPGLFLMGYSETDKDLMVKK
ncbi:MAG: hypothetical protein AB7S78_06615 [Candidatus Omnitrophota bacterium]